MSDDVIKSYLVALSYDLPSSELSHLQKFLGEADHVIANHTTGATKSLLLWQAGITSAFTAVAAATLGMVDHVASSDQKFRLMGERMMLGTQSARELSLALKAVDMTLDEAVWDPQGRKQLEESLALQQKLTAGLGPGFEKSMAQMQELQFTARSVGTELEYLSYYVVEDLMKAMGTTPDEVLNKLKAFEAWFATNMPSISREITADLLPVLHDWYSIMKSLEPLFVDLGLVFTNFVGLINGDKSIEGTTFSFKNLGHAIGDVAHDLDRFVQLLILGEKMLTHFALGAELFAEGKRREASKEFKSAFADLTPATGAGVGALAGAAGGGIAGAIAGSVGGPVGTLIGLVGGASLGAVNGAMDGNAIARIKTSTSPTDWNGPDTRFVADAENSGPGTGTHGLLNLAHGDANVKALIDAAAAKYNIPAALLHAQAAAESGQRQYDKDGKVITSKAGALGVMQLMPATAKEYGVNPYDAAQNVDGGARYMATLFQKYNGNVNAAFAAYNMGPEAYKRAMERNKPLPGETRQYLASIDAATGANSGTQITLAAGSMPINITVGGSNATPAQIADVAHRSVVSAIQQASLYPLVAQQGVQR